MALGMVCLAICSVSTLERVYILLLMSGRFYEYHLESVGGTLPHPC